MARVGVTNMASYMRGVTVPIPNTQFSFGGEEDGGDGGNCAFNFALEANNLRRILDLFLALLLVQLGLLLLVGVESKSTFV